MRVLFGFLLFCGAFGQAHAQCPATQVENTVVVRTVVDGDTIRLADNRLVRLIGINTPEIFHDQRPAQPLAYQAKRFLESLIGSSRRVAVQLGMEKEDRHGRLLAHVYLPDGTNVQQSLLQSGLAWWVAVPPNIRLLECYKKAEQVAKLKQLGIWGEVYFEPRQASKPQALQPGFQLLQGKVEDIKKRGKNLWLIFNDSVALRIAQTDLHNFNVKRIDALKGENLLVRGWAYKRKNRTVLRVRHPAVLQVIE